MISVVMATYNGEKFLYQQLLSIYHQTMQPDEVMIFDDGSSDNTIYLVKDFIRRNGLADKWSITVNQENKGFFRNFMDGAFAAHGDTIYFSDQDDIWDLKKIEVLEKCLNKPAVMMARSNVLKIDAKGKAISSPEYVGKKTLRELSITDICKWAGPGFSMGFRRKVFDFIKERHLYRETFKYHDVLCGKAAVALGKCVQARDVYDCHRLHDSNQTQTATRSFVAGRTRADQIDIVRRRKKYFRLLDEATIDNTRAECFRRFSAFAGYRERYIKHFSINDMNWLIKHQDLYLSKVGVISDTMYSIGMEKIILYFCGKYR